MAAYDEVSVLESGQSWAIPLPLLAAPLIEGALMTFFRGNFRQFVRIVDTVISGMPALLLAAYFICTFWVAHPRREAEWQ